MEFPMKFNDDKEWLEKMAEKEDGADVSVGHMSEVYSFNPALGFVFEDIEAELERAKAQGEHFVNLHEAYAVLLEEVDEVWDITKQKQKIRDPEDTRDELIQVAAMAIKALLSPIFNTPDGWKP
jgi:hypothetical protein